MSSYAARRAPRGGGGGDKTIMTLFIKAITCLLTHSLLTLPRADSQGSIDSLAQGLVIPSPVCLLCLVDSYYVSDFSHVRMICARLADMRQLSLS